MTLAEQTTTELLQSSTSQVEEQETAVIEDQTQDTENDESTETENVSEDTQTESDVDGDEGQQQHEEERKPTRAEKRLHTLLNKGKKETQENPFTQLLNAMPEPEPDENGFYSPEQVRQMASIEAARAIQMDRDVQAYKQETETFVSEIEEVGNQILEDFKDNPKLAEKVNSILTKNIRSANVRTDEKGNEVLVPVQRPSQLYAELKEALNLTTTQGTEKATAALAKQVAEGALTPGNSGRSNDESLTSLQKNLWNNPGQVAATLAKRLPRSND